MDTFTEPLPDTEIGASPTTSGEHHEGTTPACESGSAAMPIKLNKVLEALGEAIAAKAAEPVETTPKPEWRTASIVQLIADGAPRALLADVETTRLRWQPPPSLTPEQVVEVAEVIARGQRAVQPAGADAVGAMLLRLIAVHPVGNRPGAELMMETYVGDLSDLPADLLDQASAHWRRTERFFPTIAELRALVMPELAKRKKYLERLLILRSVADLPAPDGVVTLEWLSDRRAAGRRAMASLTDPRLRVAA